MKLIEIQNIISDSVISGELSNADLVQLIEQAGSYLNLVTRSDYAKQNNMSYNGAKKCRQNVKLFNVNFVIDNE